MFKAFVGLLALGGIVLLGVYWFGGSRSYDPTEAGKQAKAAIKTGMSWQQVIAAAGAEPGKYSVFRKVKKKISGQDVEYVEEGTELNFERKVFEATFNAKEMKEGFQFEYLFSHQAAFSVTFDVAGNVVGVQDEKTMANLLDTRGGG